MHCPYCGNLIEDDSVFCPFCGQKIPEQVFDAKSEMKSNTFSTQPSQPGAFPPSNVPPTQYPGTSGGPVYSTPPGAIPPTYQPYSTPWPITFTKVVSVIALIATLFVSISFLLISSFIENVDTTGEFNNPTYIQAKELLMILGVVYLLISIVFILMAYAVFKEKTWGRAISIIGYILLIIAVNLLYINIVLGIIGLYGMIFDQNTKQYYAALRERYNVNNFYQQPPTSNF